MRAVYYVQELSAAKAYEILRRISEEDCAALGFNTKCVGALGQGCDNSTHSIVTAWLW